MSIVNFDFSSYTLAVIGLGYVGLPLAVSFSSKKLTSKKDFLKKVIGFDLNQTRINELACSFDRTKELTSDQFDKATNLVFSSNEIDLIDSDIFIVTVPTPIDKFKNPDFSSEKLIFIIITTNKNNTATAPTYTIKVIIPKNSAPNIINKQEILTKSKIKKKTAWIVFLEEITMIEEKIVIIEKK